MNREIKFRSWDKLKKEMFYIPVKSGENKNFLQIDSTGLTVCNNNGFITDFELMQYTGLIDINGKKIYEGDIVKNYNQDVMVVKYIPPSFVADYFPLHQSEIIRAELKVIGNICKNPELLERAKNEL